MESLPACFRHVEWTWGHCLSVPGPVAAQRDLRAAIHLGNEPQRAGRCQDHTERVGAYNTLPLAAVVLPEPVKGVTVTDGHFDGPAMAILAHDLFSAQGESGGEKGFNGGGWFSL